MKIDKKLLLIITFVGALVVLLLVFFLTTGFSPGIKDYISAVYFAIWITAAMGMWLYGIQPYLEDRKKAKESKKAPSVAQKVAPMPSPKSGLPLRDRIREYVTERRKEEGLPVPEPLLPSKAGGGAAPVKTAKGTGSSSGAAMGAAAVSGAVAGGAAAASVGEGDLPLPDDFDEAGGGDVFGDEFPEEEGGSLPGLGDEELGSFDEEGGEPSLPGLGDEDFGSFDEGEGGESSLPGLGDEDLGSFDETEVEEGPSADTGGLPDFEGDLESDISESDISDSMDDFSEEESGSDTDLLADDTGEGGLSEDGLPDLDMPLDDDIMDEDMSSDDEFSDIEFEDIEPDET
ncbi:hypothetical protein ACKUB1_13340 [Methanospirillum stamsii]|uniref:Uncharacterized protein n=1 Tax=Methanospirillum stamsii TaxID=1277351 RepID=A0A2V2N1R4_9EURY|nr:hypothetical protein [Methanospirillum stamsii]PWR70077.1 hypothetical protein DLD82_16650 [Methanospirillum stamsii]